MNDKIVNNRVDWSDTKYNCNNILEHARPLIDIAKKLTNDEYENLQHKEQAQEALKNFVDKFVKEKMPTGLSVINSFANLNHDDIRIEVLFFKFNECRNTYRHKQRRNLLQGDRKWQKMTNSRRLAMLTPNTRKARS